MMRVYAVVDMPVGNSMLPEACHGDGKDNTKNVYIPTTITVKNQKDLAKLMRENPERYAGYSWVAFPDAKPVKVVQTTQYRIGI